MKSSENSSAQPITLDALLEHIPEGNGVTLLVHFEQDQRWARGLFTHDSVGHLIGLRLAALSRPNSTPSGLTKSLKTNSRESASQIDGDVRVQRLLPP